MSDTRLPTPPIEPAASPLIDPPRRWRVSLVWIIPLLAALIGASLVVEALMERGPTVTVTFQTAEGIEPGKTKVKFKNVDIGEVKSVRLTADRARVVVTIDLVKEAEQFAIADSRFWVVRPRLAGTGVTGLGTLLSGAYIGVDAGRSEERRTEFTGLEIPPVVASDIPGHRFRLHADDIGSLDIGSPVYFRRIRVGHVENFALEPDGKHIMLGVFINSPYDGFVTPDSRFWHASGVDINVDASGFRLETQSLASILMGGVAFETPPDKPRSPTAENGAEFDLASDHSSALKAPDGVPQTVVLRFRQSVRGLAVGAPVDFRGMTIGYVRSVAVAFDANSGDFASPVTIDIYPDRLGPNLPAADAPAMRLARIKDLVRRGMRAQLRTGNLLLGQLFVAIDFFPEAPPVRFNDALDPLELPTVPGDLQEIQQQVQSILKKIDRIPFDALGADAHRVLASLDEALKSLNGMAQRTDQDLLPELKNSLIAIARTMAAAEATLAADSPLQQDTRQALQGLAEATRSLKTLSDTLERHPESLVRGKKENAQ